MVQEKLVSSEKTMNDNNVYHDELIVPKIRFSEFIDSWEKITLNDIATFSKGKGISKNDISDKGTPCIRYGELYTKYNYLISNIDSKTDLDKSELIFSEKNDILMPCSGETAIDLASASCVTRENVAIGGDITVIRTNQYSPFITYCINFKKNEIAKFAQGVSIVHLYAKDFKDITLKIPKIEEQKKIVDFLEKIDKKIELLEKKLVLCRELELTIKNKIFNNETKNSFIKLNEICSIKKGKQLNKSDMIENGKYYVLNGGKEPSGYTNSWNVKENTITISEGGNSCGYVSFNSEKFYCGGHCYYLTFKTTDFDLNYLFHYLKYIEPKIMRLRVGSGLPNIQKGDVENINILKKEFGKQKEIGDFLESINIKISLILREKEELELFKKGLLQKMFI